MANASERARAMPSSAADRITQAESYKVEGNLLYKQKEYKKAIGKYHRALLFLKGLQDNAQMKAMRSVLLSVNEPSIEDGLTNDIKDKIKNIEIGCYNNLSVCLLQDDQPNYDRIAEYSMNVIKLDSKNVKAYYRQGLAYYHKRNFTSSLESFHQAKRHSKDTVDPSIKKYISKCETELANQDEKTKAMYKSMFSNGSAGGS
ncbi:tetratricopeptide repeat protein 9C-like [Anneissia japonica]|uniref:tetratricopeptide repeat protein 9C-like n=1 Tax=Anneissia japonica TaxID=1529436 RepID=UPI0014255B4B|nr:tetratricopeptide repeat protein 9C-like [Anneissia japonica]XP_033112772.1 tetratricopeptide repeat protein 9C-like [Anneissia japonica]